MKTAVRFIFILLIMTGCAAKPTVQVWSLQKLKQSFEVGILGRKLHEYKRIVCKCTVYDWRLIVIESDKINAYSIGDGRFAVTEGLMKLPLDQQFAALAHEVGHEVIGHLNKRRAASGVTTGAFVVLGAFIPGAGLLNHVVNPLVVAAFSKEQELEADDVAVYLLEKTEGNGGGKHMKALLLSLKDQVGASKGGIFEMHPHPDERIAEIEKILSGIKEPHAPPLYKNE